MIRFPSVGVCALVFVLLTSGVRAAESPAPAPAATAPLPPPPRLNALPVEHAYQKTLRDYLATLQPADFEHGVTQLIDPSAAVTDPEERYRYYLASKTVFPLVGFKRGVPAVNTPAKNFTLAEIETPEGVKRPPIYPDAMAQFVDWKHAGNPYYGNRALKLRAFVSMVISLTLLDEQLDNAPEQGGNRTDHLGPNVLPLTFPYPTVAEVLPPPVRAAYLAGLERLARRLLVWGPKEEDPNLDVIACVALWYAARALDDPKFTAEVDAYIERYYTEPRYFHPAGYFVDRGGLDLGFAGQTNFYSIWLALASKKPRVVEAVDKTHRLRAHVTLPQPDGKTMLGPSHFQSRYSADASKDQWEWGIFRDLSATLVTDEAAYLVAPATETDLAGAGGRRAAFWRDQIKQNPRLRTGPGYIKNEDIVNTPWQFRVFPSYNFPVQVNYAFVEYPAGAYARRKALEEANSPLLRSPFLRDENFVRAFDKAFFVVKQPSFAAIVHSGPIGRYDPQANHTPLPGPYGFGGGQLSAFWTPEAGSLLLGRRGGMTKDQSFDPVEDWRKWPIHAVSGACVDGKIFTTGRIVEPTVATDLPADGGGNPEGASVRVAGTVPRAMLGQTKALDGRLEFARTFTLLNDGVRVETRLQTTAQDNFAELYETLPVLLREGPPPAKGPDVPPTTIEFRSGQGGWTTASGEWTDGVTAVRLSRFGGAAVVEFDRPQRVKLGDEWRDTYLSRVVCRNVQIDLIEQNGRPKVVREAATSYVIRAAKK